MAHDLQGQRGAGEQPDVVARLRGADRQAGEDRVLLRAVEDRVQPGAELGERARVARELAVDAVERERELEQERAGDHPPALAGRERRRRHEADGDRERRDAVRRPAAAGGPARDVLGVGRDEERREEAVVRLDGGVEQRAVLVVLADPRGRVGDVLGGERARPEQAPQVAAADLDPRPDEPGEQQRRGVLLGGGDAARQLGRALGVELDVARLQPADVLGGERLVGRLLRAVVLVALRAQRAAVERELPAVGLRVELGLPAVGQRARHQLGEARRHARHGGAVAGRDLDHAEERPVRRADEVVGRPGADDPAATRAGAEADVAVHAPDRRGQHARRDARVGEQAGERLALGEDVAVGDDHRALAAARERLDRAQVGCEVRARLQRDLDAAGARGRLELRDPCGPGDHVRAAQAEVGELRQQAPEQRRVLPRQRGRRPAVAGRRGREQHGGAHGLAARARAPAVRCPRGTGRSRSGGSDC